MNKLLLATLVLTTMFFSGCAKIDPFSPNLKQQIENQNGQIEELKSNQNGLMFELGKIRNQNELNARDIHNAQQGLVNLRGMENSGIQFFSGDGGLIVFFSLAVMAFLFIYHYRERATKSEQAAQILAQQITIRDDPNLEDDVFRSALNTDAEADVYHLMVKAQELSGKRKN